MAKTSDRNCALCDFLGVERDFEGKDQRSGVSRGRLESWEFRGWGADLSILILAFVGRYYLSP